MSEQQISPERLGAWIHSWDTGLSSEAIFHYMTLGIKGGATPSDPSDLGRCLRLLERFPEWKPRMAEMSNVSKEWALLMPHWNAIEASFLAEAGGSLPDPRQNWSAPATYEMMRDVFYFRKDGMLFSRSAFPDEQVPAGARMTPRARHPQPRPRPIQRTTKKPGHWVQTLDGFVRIEA